MAAEPSPDARLRRTLEQLRIVREQSAQRNAIEQERRRVEDIIRDERRDAFAKTISAQNSVERRRGRSDVELRLQREQLSREWEEQQRRAQQQKKRRTTKSR